MDQFIDLFHQSVYSSLHDKYNIYYILDYYIYTVYTTVYIYKISITIRKENIGLIENYIENIK